MSQPTVTREAASVEVRLLRVGTRQMNLSLYRQLIAEPVIDPETLEFRGLVWGWVNHHKGAECDSPSASLKDRHLHLIWQKGDELRRYTLYRKPLPVGGHPRETTAAHRAYFRLIEAEVGHRLLMNEDIKTRFSNVCGECWINGKVGGDSFAFPAHPTLASIREAMDLARSRHHDFALVQEMDRLREWLAGEDLYPPGNVLTANQAVAFAELEAVWGRLYDQAAAVGQLFIGA
jgi:hypothetical protein